MVDTYESSTREEDMVYGQHNSQRYAKTLPDTYTEVMT